MNRNVFFVLAITILLYSCGSSSNSENKEIEWNGTWNYSFDGGTTNGGTGIFADYILTIDGENCKLEADGYQLGCHLNLRGQNDVTEFKLFYKSVADDLEVGCSNFDKTEPILVLTEKNGFLIIKESQLGFSEDLTKIVFEKSENGSSTTSESTTDPIELIKERFKTINDNASTYKDKSVDITDMSSEGGILTFYSKDNKIMKMNLKLAFEMGNSSTEYYFWDNELFFIYDKIENYDMPMYIEGSKVKETLENRYYFKDDKLIKWLDTNKNEKSATEMNEKSQKLVDGANKLKNYF